MKKIVLISLLTTALACNTACTDDVAYDQEQYASVLHMKTSGVVDIEFYNIGQDVTFETYVSKGGTTPSVTGDASLVVFTEEELAAYNAGYGSNFKLLPADCYTMPAKISFEPGQEAVPVKFVLKSNIGNLDLTQSYILPVRLESDGHSVYEYKNSLLLHPNVITPTVSLEHMGVHKITMGVGDDPVKFETSILFDYFNEWTFTVNLNTNRAELEELVNKYNNDNSATGITYQLLPEANYELPSSVAFTANDFSKSLSVELNSDNNLQEGDYLLPIVLKNITGAPLPFEVSDKICYIHLEYKDILPYLNILLNAPNDDIVTASGSDLGGSNNYLPFRIFDGSPSWVWQTHTGKNGTSGNSIDEPYNDPIYGQYIDINIKNAGFTLSKKLDFFMQVKWSDLKPHVIRIYGKEEGGVDWMPLTEEMMIGNKLRTPTSEEDNAIGTATNQTIYKYSEMEQQYIELNGKKIVALRFAVLKSYKGKTWAEQTGVYDQTVKPTGNSGWPAVAISELKLYGK
ncbi:DUF1735 domain-containing protein [Bacteroides sp. GM023]|uniref:DUF1735 domain-containing protein n=1 Tax=Bacteroides sp. GM023 TaxID=2723058 RepID=UPI00168AA376|nr:DUF1735 domain-containing protein [Bacteroides sp. GM023]MBD3588503.1 DUF1735 domain-containing protein [Bacteroides sp. GM023]